ncbi:MAG TPA: acyl-CoA dehydrogenase family protein, partial [Thermoplasmata archaeon]|nr:acyl-CoA dehydrogenase family protein [Thermoplasmata archaeon]
MDFELSDEEGAFRDAVRKFGDRVLRPNETRIDEEGRIPREVLDAMAKLGLLAMPAASEYGGLGASATLTEIAAEEIGRGDSSMATAVFFLLEA